MYYAYKMWFEKATLNAGVVELVDAIDSKSIIGNYVWVRVPPPAPTREGNVLKIFLEFKFARKS